MKRVLVLTFNAQIKNETSEDVSNQIALYLENQFNNFHAWVNKNGIILARVEGKCKVKIFISLEK